MFPHVRLISFGFGKKGKPLGLRHDQVVDARGIYDPAHECPHGLGSQPAVREYLVNEPGAFEVIQSIMDKVVHQETDGP